MKSTPPPPQTLIEKLLAMEVGDYRLIDENPPTSVRASISRLKTLKVGRGRNYKTRLKGDATEVWRLP